MKRRRNILEQGDLLPVLLLLPSILVVFVVMFIPLLYGVFMSFYNYHMGSIDLKEDFISISNYVRLFKDKVFLKAVGNTLYFTAAAIAGDLILGTVIAVWLQSLTGRLKSILRPICTMPLLVSPIIIGLIWKYMFNINGGLIYWVLGLFGITSKQFPGLAGTSFARLLRTAGRSFPLLSWCSAPVCSAYRVSIMRRRKWTEPDLFKNFFIYPFRA